MSDGIITNLSQPSSKETADSTFVESIINPEDLPKSSTLLPIRLLANVILQSSRTLVLTLFVCTQLTTVPITMTA